MTACRQILLASFLLALLLPAQAWAFTDTEGSPYADAIDALASRGIVHGYEHDLFRPESTINRAELLTIILDSRYPGKQPRDLRCFKDLEVHVPQWYARTTCAAMDLGIVNGYPDGTFRPERTVNLAEALKMTMRAFRIDVPAVGTAWYEPYLTEARHRGILVELLKNPSHPLTRGEMASITYALLRSEEDGPATHSTSGICGNGTVEPPEQCDDGNVQDGDGCSSICIDVPEPIRIAFLRVDQQTTGSLQTVARGQRGVALLKFTATAARQDAILTSITLRPSVGSLLYGQHFSISMDRDGDGVYDSLAQGEGKVSGGHLTFDEFFGGGVAIPQGVTVPFVIRADLVSTLGPVSLGLEFATDLSDYVSAEGAVDSIELNGIETNGVCHAPNCFIQVNTVGSTDINVQSRGSMTVTEDSLPVRSRILVGGSTTEELLRLRLHAESETIDLKAVRIDGVPSTVESLLLYELQPGQRLSDGGHQPFAQATHGQCSDEPSTRFCAVLGLGTLLTPPTRDQVLAVAARMKSDQVGGIGGALVTLSISGDTTHPAIEARGQQSQQELLQNDGDSLVEGEVMIGTATPGANHQILGKTNDTALASINSIVTEGVATARPIPSGFQPIGSFRLSAVPHTNTLHGSNDVILKSFVFRVNAQNVQMDPQSLKLAQGGDLSVMLPCTAAGGTGNVDVTCTNLHGVIEDRLEQGEFAIYTLFANVTNPQIANTSSTLQVSLPILGSRGQTNSVLWSDGETDFSWVDIPVTSVDGTAYRQ